MKSFLTLLALLASSAFAAQVSYVGSPTGGLYAGGGVSRVDGSHRTVIYDFCAQQACTDGATPLSNLIEIEGGRSLIGVTSAGGGEGGGVIYRLDEQADGAWTETVLSDVCPYWHECGRFGYPSSFRLLPEGILEGVSELADGTKGVRWRAQQAARGDGYVVVYPQYWGWEPK